MIGQISAGDHVDVFAGFQVQPEGAQRPQAGHCGCSSRTSRCSRRSVGRHEGEERLAEQNQPQNVVLRVTD